MTIKSQFLDLVTDHPEGMSLDDIHKALGANKNSINSAARRLELSGDISVDRTERTNPIYKRVYKEYGKFLLQEVWRGVA